MFKGILLTILFSSFTFQENHSCIITQKNIGRVLQFGVREKAFERDIPDTFAFWIDNNESDIKEGQIFFLKNNRIAIYKQNSNLKLWQPFGVDSIVKINFVDYYYGEKKDGYLKMKCVNDTFQGLDSWYLSVIE